MCVCASVDDVCVQEVCFCENVCVQEVCFCECVYVCVCVCVVGGEK